MPTNQNNIGYTITSTSTSNACLNINSGDSYNGQSSAIAGITGNDYTIGDIQQYDSNGICSTPGTTITTLPLQTNVWTAIPQTFYNYIAPPKKGDMQIDFEKMFFKIYDGEYWKEYQIDDLKINTMENGQKQIVAKLSQEITVTSYKKFLQSRKVLVEKMRKSKPLFSNLTGTITITGNNNILIGNSGDCTINIGGVTGISNGNYIANGWITTGTANSVNGSCSTLTICNDNISAGNNITYNSL